MLPGLKHFFTWIHLFPFLSVCSAFALSRFTHWIVAFVTCITIISCGDSEGCRAENERAINGEKGKPYISLRKPNSAFYQWIVKLLLSTHAISAPLTCFGQCPESGNGRTLHEGMHVCMCAQRHWCWLLHLIFVRMFSWWWNAHAHSAWTSRSHWWSGCGLMLLPQWFSVISKLTIVDPRHGDLFSI